jgi:hypothetical protein
MHSDLVTFETDPANPNGPMRVAYPLREAWKALVEGRVSMALPFVKARENALKACEVDLTISDDGCVYLVEPTANQLDHVRAVLALKFPGSALSADGSDFLVVGVSCDEGEPVADAITDGLDEAFNHATDAEDLAEAWLDEAVEAARVAYAESDEPHVYILRDATQGADAITTEFDGTLEGAIEEAHDWARKGYECDKGTTTWVDTGIRRDCDEDECENITTQIDPDEPACDEEQHDWQSPHDIVGGSESNPGVRGHAGGVIVSEVCMLCGCGKTTNTFATRPDNGTRGYTTVEYQVDQYLEALERAS